MDARIRGIIFKSIALFCCLLSFIMYILYEDEGMGASIAGIKVKGGPSNEQSAGQYFWWVGFASYFYFSCCLLIFACLDMGPDRELNLGLCIVFGIYYLLAGGFVAYYAFQTDLDYLSKVEKEKILKMICSAVFGLVIGIIYLVDGILIFVMD